MSLSSRVSPSLCARAGALVISCLALGACQARAEEARPSAEAARPSAVEAPPSAVEQGRYLVEHVYSCVDCHTPKLPSGELDRSRYLAGVVCRFDVDPTPGRGCINSKNLTHHPSGLANVRDDRALMAMFLDGRRPDGKALHPIMPYWELRNMPPEHAQAIVSYLRTVPGVEHRVPPSEPPFDAAPRAPAPPVDLALVPEVPAAAREAESARRGRRLAAVACIGCHTPPPASGAGVLDFAKVFAGGRRFRASALGLASPPQPPLVYSANLTQHESGLLGWSADDIVRVLREGKDRDGRGICPPMPAGPGRSFHGLEEQDARDIAHYLLTLPGVDQPTEPCALGGP